MPSRFDDQVAQALGAEQDGLPAELRLRAYTARLLGQEARLVLHGGGNVSLKLAQPDLWGEAQEVLWVKGSGVDLQAMQAQDLTPMDLGYLRRLRELAELSDEALENVLTTRRLDGRAALPSVETLLHAFLPHRVVDHTHADSILVLTHQPEGAQVVRDALGPKVAVVPYVIAGLPLAKAVADAYAQDPSIEAVVVLQHGLFTFADDVRACYERMIVYVDRAEAFIAAKKGGGRRPEGPLAAVTQESRGKAARLAAVLRGACAKAATRGDRGQLHHVVVETRSTPELLAASLAPDVQALCNSGVITPDHAIRTKNSYLYLAAVPEEDAALAQMVRDALRAYAEREQQVLACHQRAGELAPPVGDNIPRVCLAAGVGLLGLGETRQAARRAADIATHTIAVKRQAEAVGAYLPIDEAHVFEMETWPLQRRKLNVSTRPLLQGQVAFVTGAAGAIGVGIADRLLAAGAAVVLSDVDRAGLETVQALLGEKFGADLVEALPCDVTNADAVDEAFAETSRRLGGVDIVVPNAGIAHVARLEELKAEQLRSVVDVNLMGSFNVLRACIPVFRRQGSGGNIVLVSSKNVFDPGAAFGAYSASKAGAHQLGKIAALELAELGVRVNMVNPDAVFGCEGVSSKLWDLVGPDRMKARGLDPAGLREYYRQRNLLKVSVQAEHVGNAVVFFASEQTPTTGATLPIDGGVPAAFPR